MPRPRRIGRIFFEPEITYFKPVGIPMLHLQNNILTKEELEAIRLIDLKNTEQNKAAKQMKISQPTFSRLLDSARKKIADSLINAKAIKIQGGIYKMVQPTGRGMGFGRGAGSRGRMGGIAAGPGGVCKCPKCGATAPHQIGIPCTQQKCPKCNSTMARS